MKDLNEIDKVLLEIFKKLYDKCDKRPKLPDIKIILPLNYGKEEEGESREE